MKTQENKGKFVAYYRVSTERQGVSGLGLEAQKKTVLDYLNGGKWELVGEYVEVISGKREDRPELNKALALAKAQGATVIVAKMDRLGRKASHLLSMLDKSGCGLYSRKCPMLRNWKLAFVPLSHKRKAVSYRHAQRQRFKRQRCGV
jgi:predicted site-specific integrase-resolvase